MVMVNGGIHQDFAQPRFEGFTEIELIEVGEYFHKGVV